MAIWHSPSPSSSRTLFIACLDEMQLVFQDQLLDHPTALHLLITHQPAAREVFSTHTIHRIGVIVVEEGVQAVQCKELHLDDFDKLFDPSNLMEATLDQRDLEIVREIHDVYKDKFANKIIS